MIQIGEELDGMVVIRNGDNRQGVCPLKFLQEVWQRHSLDKVQFEGPTFYPPKQPSTSQFNSSTLVTLQCQLSKEDGYMTRGFLTRRKLASYPQARRDQYKTAPDLVRSSMSCDGTLYGSEHEGKENILVRDKVNQVDKTPDVLRFGNNTINADNQKILRRKSLAKNLIPISSSTRPLGLPSSCSPSHYQRKLSRFRYRNIKNITSLSRPLLIGWIDLRHSMCTLIF